MVEIRPIKVAEAEEFLELLCDVFDLDFARAQGVFFNEPLFDLTRKWALIEKGEILSILTTVPLEFGFGPGIGIAGVATRLDCQGQGLASRLLNRVLEVSEARGEGAAYLFAKQTTLYERSDFRVIDHVIRAPIVTKGNAYAVDPLPVEEVVRVYDLWAEENPLRLRRDARRWNYWKWNFKICTPFLGGYVCPEGSLVRECLIRQRAPDWPLVAGSQWLGLSSMAEQMCVPIGPGETDLLLMARNSPGIPQMFMTDQF